MIAASSVVPAIKKSAEEIVNNGCRQTVFAAVEARCSGIPRRFLFIIVLQNSSFLRGEVSFNALLLRFSEAGILVALYS